MNTYTPMNQFLLALIHKKIILPENILFNIYNYSRPKLSKICKIQIINNSKAKMALTFMNNYIEYWDRNIDVPPPEDNLAGIPLILSDYLKCIPIDERINLRHDISQCQCCVRHYGKQTNENIKKIGKPIIKGEKPDFGEIYTLNPRFKRFGTTCTCNCRHVARFLHRSILNQI
jgi:hypothetical protein